MMAEAIALVEARSPPPTRRYQNSSSQAAWQISTSRSGPSQRSLHSCLASLPQPTGDMAARSMTGSAILRSDRNISSTP